jgi:mRNA-degrading endonuclease toxin of MazEF toxin-antitoxin module
LTRDSTALCHQVTTLDRGKFHDWLGSLTSSYLRAIDDGLRIALDLES